MHRLRHALRRAVSAICVAVLAVAPAFVMASGAAAETGDRVLRMSVYSPAMQRDIPLQVLRPANTAVPAPTLYLLNGAGGGEDSANWRRRTDLEAFFADKHVNIVIPMEGAFSYYTDWEQPDPELAELLGNNGRNMWATFLTEELPPVIDAELGTTGENALAGISMAGTSVLDLSIRAPHLYRSVAAYSGCAMTSDPVGQTFIKTVLSMGGASAEHMWGPLEGGQWEERDPYVQAHRLPPIPMYITTGNGLPGVHDTRSSPRLQAEPDKFYDQLIVGGLIESATHYCTARLAERTRALGRTDITYRIRPSGTHSWGYWQDDLHESWPVLAKSLGTS